MYRLRALNRVNNIRALFKVISPIEIQKMPRSGIGKLLTLPGYSSGCHSLPEADWFTYDLRYISVQSYDPRYRWDCWFLVYNTHNCTVIYVTSDVWIYTKKSYIISLSTLKHSKNHNQMSFDQNLKTDVYLIFIL